MRGFFIKLLGFFYHAFAKPIFFRFDPLFVHERIVLIGQQCGRFSLVRKVASFIFRVHDQRLRSGLFGIDFENPIGLAAGYDYEARLTQILPSMGFGFGTVGTLTYRSYKGNPPPLLGRLPKSKSLMVNKGFKNDGVEKTLGRLKDVTFSYPVGISIGQTNDETIRTVETAIVDIVQGFRVAEQSRVSFAYYELNISCPNLLSSVNFFDPLSLRKLLEEIAKLGISRPVFIKMPISKTDDEILSLMGEIVKHSTLVKAVIIGNLQKEKNTPALLKEEVEKFSVGNFSGMACQSRSDDLIELVYRNFGEKIKIIGCGGVFCAEDAYRKITLGASLVQLVTGLIFEGPQVIAAINMGLVQRLEKEGYNSISDAIGSAVR